MSRIGTSKAPEETFRIRSKQNVLYLKLTESIFREVRNLTGISDFNNINYGGKMTQAVMKSSFKRERAFDAPTWKRTYGTS